ncbi:MAG: 30S ribosomal protein S9 [Chloroflexi bacterium]|nr:30S ribosomal protein S9 [Chloroflexota bacterium]
MVTGKYFEGIGRRKAATARVRVTAGTGDYMVNGKSVKEYFPLTVLLSQATSPLRVTQNEGRFGVSVLVKGGGIPGQSVAVSLGLARALLLVDATFKKALRNAGLLTRDPRVKERKKPGLKKARKAKQYTKR